MMKPREIAFFRRIVIGFPGPPDSHASLEIAAEMARRLRSELHGIFIEDQGLIDWCASRPMRNVSIFGTRQVAQDALLLDLSAGAALARQRLVQTARALGLEARFEVSRAGLTDAAIAGPDDLLVIIEPADPSVRHSHPFAGMLSRAARATMPILYVPHGAGLRAGPIIALVSQPQGRASELAAGLAAGLGEEHVVVAEPDLARLAAAPPGERLIVIDRASPILADVAGFAALLTRRRVPALIFGTPPPKAQEG